MSEVTTSAFLALVAGRRGHFQLESGHHGGLWLDLDPLFTDPKRIEPFVTALTTALRQYDVAFVSRLASSSKSRRRDNRGVVTVEEPSRSID